MSKPRAKRHFVAAWAAQYHAPYGEMPIGPPMPGVPREGYAWGGDGREIKLVITRARRKVQRAVPAFDDLLIDPEVTDHTILTGEEDDNT